MTTSLSSSAQKVQNVLSGMGYDFKVIEKETTTRTAQEAAEAAGCELGQIVKSLVFTRASSGGPILILTSGNNRVNEKMIAAILGEIIEMADPEFVRQITGFAIGGIPPVGHAQKIITLIDKDLLKFSTVWAAAGTPNAIFELPPTELQKMTGGQIIAVH